MEAGGLNLHLRGLLWGKLPVETAGVAEDLREFFRGGGRNEASTHFTLEALFAKAELVGGVDPIKGNLLFCSTRNLATRL